MTKIMPKKLHKLKLICNFALKIDKTSIIII